MKILAIRGKHLASLADEFEVDFSAEPLASAGLFAITGPTGAGKSTLLDALCLPLYDSVPRLSRSPNVKFPDPGDSEGVVISDARTILRRGTGMGFAEVDYQGSDGVLYRSRWTVRRSRGKANGKLQTTEITLTRLSDNQVLSDKRKTETLKLIEQTIGLSYDQFTRSVLLAQNDFATFLKSSDDDRAALLQTLTGTKTFEHISQQAFVRQKAEEANLARLEQQLQDQTPLSEEQRKEANDSIEAGQVQLKALQTQNTALEEHLRWHAERERRKNAHALADQEHQRATGAQAAGADRRARLDMVKRVQPAGPLDAEVRRLGTELSGAREQSLKTSDLLQAATARMAAAKEAQSRAHGKYETAQELRDQAQPVLDQATGLDANIALLKPDADKAQTEFETARLAHKQAAQKLSELNNRLTEIDRDFKETETWLAAHDELRPLAESWQRWDALLKQAHDKSMERHAADKHLREIDQAQTQSALDEQAALKSLKASRAAFDACTVSLEQKRQALEVYDPAALAQRRLVQDQRLEDLAQAEKAWTAQQQERGRLDRLQQQQVSLIEKIDRETDTRLSLLERRPALEAAEIMANQMLDQAKLAASQSAEAMRAQLQPGAPCPVCGGTEHPYAAPTTPLDAVLASLSKSARDARVAHDTLNSEISACEQSIKSDRQQKDRLDEERESVQGSLARLEQTWKELVLHVELEGVEARARSDWLLAQAAAAQTALQTIRNEETACNKALQERNDAQKQCDAARQRHDADQATLNILQQEKAGRSAKRQEVAKRLAQCAAELDEVCRELDGPFGGSAWRQTWQSDPARFKNDCHQQVERWTKHRTRLTSLERQRIEQDSLVRNQAQTLQNCQEILDSRSRERDKANALLKDLCERRATLLEGRSVTQVQTQLDADIKTAKLALDQANESHQHAQADSTRHDEAHQHCQREINRLQTELTKAQANYSAWLDRFNAQSPHEPLSTESLRALLVHDHQWIGQEEEALRVLDEAVTSTAAILKTCHEALLEHDAARATDLNVDEIKAKLQDLSVDIAACEQAIFAARQKVDLDNKLRQKSEALLKQIEEQKAITHVWAQLGDLIGSSTGKKFRNFAQGMTLDILLSHANEHMKNLTGRYRLERNARAQQSLSLLVVDQEMGDEVRSAHSLSGGESFLVSLALALGLASLSSSNIKVESLFIDEGFGSLDADSLNVAMEALDNLQAFGRKVGVISHVQEMTERIGTRVVVQRQAGGRSRIVVA